MNDQLSMRFMVDRMAREGRSERTIVRAVRQAERRSATLSASRLSLRRLFRPATA
jgi:hypothetical protein